MLGSELPRENASRTIVRPSAAVSAVSRRTPVNREMMVPTAMMADDCRIFCSSSPIESAGS